jgi:hypothetical protein
MSGSRELREIDERLDGVERRSRLLMLAGAAIAGAAAAAWLIWRFRRRGAARPPSPRPSGRMRLRAVPGPGRNAARRNGARPPGPRRKRTD